MNIGVNSRIFQNSNSGIPNFIEHLYKTLLRIDKKDTYIFFQTNLNKIIGQTDVLALAQNTMGAAIYDNFLLTRQIVRRNIAIFHGPANVLPMFLPQKIKCVLTIHDLSSLIFPKNHSKIFNIYYKYSVGRSLKRADIIVSDSENTKQDIKRFYNIPDKKIKTIYLGVNKSFTRSAKTKPLIDKKYFFSLTTHPKRKNIVTILEILHTYKDFKKYCYVIAGLIEPQQRKELDELIIDLGLKEQVIIYGYATDHDLVNLYQNADFFVYPSFYEGFGFPVVEAMMCKCPVITSNNSSLREITPSKKWLINPNDKSNIYKKMKAMMLLTSSERRKLIRRNYEFAKDFTWERCAREYLGVFQSLAQSAK